MRTQWMEKLAERIAEAMMRQTEFIVGGGHQDYPAYTRGVGYIDGLKDALRFMEEVEDSMFGKREE